MDAVLVSDRTREGLTLWRIELVAGGRLVDCTRWTVNPIVAHRDGARLAATWREPVAA